MNFLEMMREGGPLAMVAVFLGALGTLLGVISLVIGFGGSRAGFGLGVATLVLATLSSGAGIGGTLVGKKQVEAAVVFVDNDVDRDLIMRAGHKEASGAATLGAFGALLPLVLGALGALAGARAGGNPQRQQGLDVSQTQMQGAESSGRAVLAAVFIGIAALGASGAWVTGHRPPPPSKYDFDVDDHDAWDLVRALDDVQRATKLADADRLSRGCERLSGALARYWKSSDPRQWPRVFDGMPAKVTGWKEAAGACVEAELSPPPGNSLARAALTTDALLDSPLLLDDELKRRVLAREAARVDAQPEGAEPAGGEGELDKSEIQRVMRSAIGNIKLCFERELVKNPTLEGKLVVELVISTTGAVSSAAEVEGPFPDARVTACVTGEVKKLKFPAPSGGVVQVRYPFVFKAAQ